MFRLRAFFYFRKICSYVTNVLCTSWLIFSRYFYMKTSFINIGADLVDCVPWTLYGQEDMTTSSVIYPSNSCKKKKNKCRKSNSILKIRSNFDANIYKHHCNIIILLLLCNCMWTMQVTRAKAKSLIDQDPIGWTNKCKQMQAHYAFLCNASLCVFVSVFCVLRVQQQESSTRIAANFQCKFCRTRCKKQLVLFNTHVFMHNSMNECTRSPHSSFVAQSLRSRRKLSSQIPRMVAWLVRVLPCTIAQHTKVTLHHGQ